MRDEPSKLERLGLWYFRVRTAGGAAPPPALDAVHVVNAHERAAMRRVQLWAVARAALAGALSGGISAWAEYVAEASLPPGAGFFSRASLHYWLFLGGVTLAASLVEILFLYWDTLRSVHELTRQAGLELFGADRDSSDQALVDGLVRAALELPNPVDLSTHVDPHREVRGWQLALASLAYKAKVGVTNFLVKMLVRRVLGRVGVRSVVGAFVPFVAVPVTAAWNAIVTWRVLREARVRAMGPSALAELLDAAFADVHELSPRGALAAQRAVAAAIVRTRDPHPNLVRMLSMVAQRAPHAGDNPLDDVALFLTSLQALAPDELRLAMRLLALAAVVDGSTSRRERQLWAQARASVGAPLEAAAFKALGRAFLRGDVDTVERLRAL